MDDNRHVKILLTVIVIVAVLAAFLALVFFRQRVEPEDRRLTAEERAEILQGLKGNEDVTREERVEIVSGLKSNDSVSEEDRRKILEGLNSN